ncbi:hypothetical protein DL98DRAFT_416709, partial [Cadophora sp. DSE1049]
AQVYGHRNAILFAATALCLGLLLWYVRFLALKTFGIEFCAMVITLVTRSLVRLPQELAKKSKHAAQRIEFLSAALLLVSVAVPLFALNLGGEVFAWRSPVVISIFCLSPVLAALFYYAETRVATTPIVPKRFIQNRHIAIALACALPMKFAFDQLRFSFGTYLQARSFGRETPFTDWALTCVYLGRALGTIVCGLLIRRYHQPLLYAFFGLSQAVSADLGIAISLAAEGTMVRSKLNNKLVGYRNADEVGISSLYEGCRLNTNALRLSARALRT